MHRQLHECHTTFEMIYFVNKENVKGHTTVQVHTTNLAEFIHYRCLYLLIIFQIPISRKGRVFLADR